MSASTQTRIPTTLSLHTHLPTPPSPPHVVCSAAWSSLHNLDEFNTKYKDAARNFFYQMRKNKLPTTLGTSSFGTVVRACELLNRDLVLGQPDANLNSTFVIGYELDTERERCLVLLSSLKGLFTAYLATNSGFSEGLLSFDFTYKIFKEKLNFLTMGTTDIQQRHHFCAFGPSSHQDEETCRTSSNFLKDAAYQLINAIHSGVFPDEWLESLKTELTEQYYPHINPDKLSLKFGTILSDMADAIPNGVLASGLVVTEEERVVDDDEGVVDDDELPPTIRSVVPDHIRLKSQKNCWSHVWMAVLKTGVAKLNKTGDAKKDQDSV